jgi:alkylation response protein AidB-like acyl-CoA dehydrogenase
MEEVSKVCATSGLILAVQELGSLGLKLAGSQHQQLVAAKLADMETSCEAARGLLYRFGQIAKIMQIYEGTNEIQRLVIAREMLKESRVFLLAGVA